MKQEQEVNIGIDLSDDNIGNGIVDPKLIEAYINQQITKKTTKLYEEVSDMIDNFQVEVLRQFQIQRGKVDEIVD